MSPKILLTGAPGVGKTTVIREIARLMGDDAAGFYTEETREAGKRMGFDIVTLSGHRAVLSRKNRKSRYRVGMYGVDLREIDSVAVPAIEDAVSRKKTIIIDEIGKMELFSKAFRESVSMAFEAPNQIVAVIMLKSDAFTDSIKRRHDVKTIRVTKANRTLLPREIFSELGYAS